MIIDVAPRLSLIAWPLVARNAIVWLAVALGSLAVLSWLSAAPDLQAMKLQTMLRASRLDRKPAASTLPCSHITATCDSWCEGAAPDTRCWHPEPTHCLGAFCCLSCDMWLRFLQPNVPSCSCEEFRLGACFADDCVPCSTSCFPHNQSGAPLGSGVLCTSSFTCEPCCQNKHNIEYCRLECPCNAGGSDCI